MEAKPFNCLQEAAGLREQPSNLKQSYSPPNSTPSLYRRVDTDKRMKVSVPTDYKKCSRLAQTRAPEVEMRSEPANDNVVSSTPTFYQKINQSSTPTIMPAQRRKPFGSSSLQRAMKVSMPTDYKNAKVPSWHDMGMKGFCNKRSAAGHTTPALSQTIRRNETTAFIQPSQQKSQMTTQKRKNPCQYCGKDFPNNSRLERHIRSHTGERPFSCSVCGNRFKQKCHLTVHARRHQEQQQVFAMNAMKRRPQFVLPGFQMGMHRKSVKMTGGVWVSQNVWYR